VMPSVPPNRSPSLVSEGVDIIMQSNPIIRRRYLSAKVRCVNRQSKTLFDRYYWVDTSTLHEAERGHVEAHARRKLNASDFVQIRPYLTKTELPPDVRSEDFDSFGSFIVWDYFEDEEGNALDEIGLIQVLIDQEYPILLTNVVSVLRLGPTGIRRKEQWTVESSNAFAHFFQLVQVIGSSEWLQVDLSMTSSGPFWQPRPGGESSGISSFQCPNLGHTYSILSPIRQLYASDEAFNRTCNTYMRHVSDDRKLAWIKERKKMFNRYLDSIPSPFSVSGLKVRELLDLLIYGAGLVHYAETPERVRQDFKRVMTENPREKVVFAFVMSCREIYSHANSVYHVFRQDYQHWIQTEGIASPDMIYLVSLFRSHEDRSTRSASSTKEPDTTVKVRHAFNDS
jgi:hypothetical protein